MENGIGWLLTHLDLYCERTDTSLFSEPLNLLSNLAFYGVAARIFYLRKMVHSPLHRRELGVLGLLAILVGTGSGLFHSWATRLSQIADVVPIGIYVAVSLFYYLRNLHRENLPLRTPLILAVLTLTLPVVFAKVSGLDAYLSKGETYLGIAPTLLIFAFKEGVWERRRRLFLAAGLFLIAFVFRTLDTPFCDIFPKGSHFLWHLFTAITAYMMASIQAVTGRRVGNS